MSFIGRNITVGGDIILEGAQQIYGLQTLMSMTCKNSTKVWYCTSTLILVSDSKTDSSSSIFFLVLLPFSLTRVRPEGLVLQTSQKLQDLKEAYSWSFSTLCRKLAGYTTCLFLNQPPGQRLNRYPLNKDYMAIENIYVIDSAFSRSKRYFVNSDNYWYHSRLLSPIRRAIVFTLSSL